MLVIPLTELVDQLEDTAVGWGTLHLFLFVANVVPDLVTTLAALTAGRPAWCDPVVMTGRTAAAPNSPMAFLTWDDVTFLNTSGGSTNVYGYAVTDDTDAILRWAERGPAAPVAVADGQSYTVRPFYSRLNQT